MTTGANIGELLIVMKIVDRFMKELTPFANSPLQPALSDVEVQWAGAVPPGKDLRKTIVVGEGAELRVVFEHLYNYKAQHFVQINRAGFVRDIIISALLINKPALFFSNPSAFFVNNFSGEPNYEKQTRKLSFSLKSTEEKAELLTILEKFILEDSRTKNYFPQVAVLIDELLSNAFFNAPIDALGIYQYKNADRRTTVKLSKACRVFCVHDNTRLIVGCEDYYGSLQSESLVSLLHGHFTAGQSETRSVGPGAGLGCKMMIENSSGFYACVDPMQKTLVVCELPLNLSVRKIEEMAKNIHISTVKA
jgi:hypothetical protein